MLDCPSPQPAAVEPFLATSCHRRQLPERGATRLLASSDFRRAAAVAAMAHPLRDQQPRTAAAAAAAEGGCRTEARTARPREEMRDLPLFPGRAARDRSGTEGLPSAAAPANHRPGRPSAAAADHIAVAAVRTAEAAVRTVEAAGHTRGAAVAVAVVGAAAAEAILPAAAGKPSAAAAVAQYQTVVAGCCNHRWPWMAPQGAAVGEMAAASSALPLRLAPRPPASLPEPEP